MKKRLTVTSKRS